MILFDLRHSYGTKISGGGIYALKQYEQLKFLDHKVVLNERSISIPVEKTILAKDLQSFLSANEGIFISGMPYDLYKFHFNNWRLIITIHGLRYLEEESDWSEILFAQSLRDTLITFCKQFLPNWYYRFRKKQYQKIIEIKCREIKVLTVSEYSKSSLELEFPSLKSRIILTSTPSEIKTLDVSPIKLSKIESPEFFVLLNGERWVKNLTNAYKALKIFNKTQNKNYKIITTGKPNTVLRKLYSNSVIFMDYMKEKELNFLISRSHGLIFSSHNEGFGYPPLRALQLEVPVFASAIPVIIEVYSGSVNYFDKNSPRDIARVLSLGNKVDAKTRSKQISKIYANQEEHNSILIEMLRNEE